MRSSMALDTPLGFGELEVFLVFPDQECALGLRACRPSATSARFFSSEDSGANWRAAILACLPSRSASCFSAAFVPAWHSHNIDKIVAVNDLVVGFVTQNFFNPACMQSFDPIQLLGAVVDQTTGELFTLQIHATHALADTENAAHFLQTRWQKTLALSAPRHRCAPWSTTISPLGFKIVCDPMLAAGQAVSLPARSVCRLVL